MHVGNVIKLNDKRQRDVKPYVPEQFTASPDTIEDRIKRIRASLERINVLMAEMKRNLQTTAEKVEVITDEDDNRI
jgi:hypothetical protein